MLFNKFDLVHRVSEVPSMFYTILRYRVQYLKLTIFCFKEHSIISSHCTFPLQSFYIQQIRNFIIKFMFTYTFNSKAWKVPIYNYMCVFTKNSFLENLQ